jgi:hypothetical protein
LDPDSKILGIRIRIEKKCWIQIRIRIESVLIHNPGSNCAKAVDPDPRKFLDRIVWIAARSLLLMIIIILKKICCIKSVCSSLF